MEAKSNPLGQLYDHSCAVMSEKCEILLDDKVLQEKYAFRSIGAIMTCFSVETQSFYEPFSYVGSPMSLIGALKRIGHDMICCGALLNVSQKPQFAALSEAVSGATLECLPQTCLFVGVYWNAEESKEGICYAASGSMTEAEGLVELMIDELFGMAVAQDGDIPPDMGDPDKDDEEGEVPL